MKVNCVIFAYEMEVVHEISNQKAHTLTKSLSQLMSKWALKNQDLARILGVSAAKISRCERGTAFIRPQSKEGEIALALLRIFRSLYSFVGTNLKQHHQWLSSYNQALQGTPLELMHSLHGLYRVLSYLDAMRSKI